MFIIMFNISEHKLCGGKNSASVDVPDKSKFECPILIFNYFQSFRILLRCQESNCSLLLLNLQLVGLENDAAFLFKIDVLVFTVEKTKHGQYIFLVEIEF